VKKKPHKQAVKKALSADNSAVSPWLRWFTIAGLMALPFFVLFWMAPFVGKQTIGNDYQTFWIEQQLFLQFSLRNGTFPLYAPGFTGGWTASALSLGQLWHPMSWIAAHLPGYWSGYAHEMGTLLRFLSLGAVHLALLMFLRRLRLAPVMALVISFITVYNLRMLDMLRYGTSLESYVAFLLLCMAMVWHYITPTKRLGPACITLFTWLLVVSGHPQMMFIGLLGAAIICLLTPFYLHHLFSDEKTLARWKIWKFYLSVALSVMVGILLASAYILPFYFEYLLEGWRGKGFSFQWACGYQDTLGGLLYNLSNPFNSDVHGAFGGSALMVPALLTPLLLIGRNRFSWPVLFLWLACVATLVMTLGSNGPLYWYFWNYFPLARTFRIPGRFAMVVPFMNLLLLAWIARLRPLRLPLRGDIRVSPLALLAVAALLLLVILNIFPPNIPESRGPYPRCSPVNLNDIPTQTVMLTIGCGFASLLALLFYCTLPRLKLITGIILITAVLLQVTATLRWGTWLAPKLRTPTFTEMSAEQQKRFAFRGFLGDGSKIVMQHLQRTFLEPTLARLCPQYTVVSSTSEAYARMAQERSIDHIYIENYSPTHQKPTTPTPDSPGIDSVELKYNSYNRLKFDVTCARPAFFVFTFPYSPRWQGFVNAQRVLVYRCNGIEQAIRLPAGNWEVEFRYWSWPALTGMALSCLTLFLAVIRLLAHLRPRPVLLPTIIVVACLCMLVFLTWFQSLYGGKNIGTKYSWTSKAIGPHLSSRHNLAYGKMTAMSSRAKHVMNDSACGVDGQREPESGFITALQNQPWWLVDLGQVKTIAHIDIYKNTNSKDCLPFDVMISSDARRWFIVTAITEKGEGNYWQILTQNVTARYIRLQGRGLNCLAFAEVEVYGPQDSGLNKSSCKQDSALLSHEKVGN